MGGCTGGSTAQWRLGRDCGIIQAGVNRKKPLDNFSWREVPNNVIKYFIGMEYNKFLCRRKLFSNFAERP